LHYPTHSRSLSLCGGSLSCRDSMPIDSRQRPRSTCVRPLSPDKVCSAAHKAAPDGVCLTSHKAAQNSVRRACSLLNAMSVACVAHTEQTARVNLKQTKPETRHEDDPFHACIRCPHRFAGARAICRTALADSASALVRGPRDHRPGAHLRVPCVSVRQRGHPDWPVLPLILITVGPAFAPLPAEVGFIRLLPPQSAELG
jgi:hypothetical protein